MSFLDSVLSSIETGRPAPIAPPPPVRTPAPPVSSSNVGSRAYKPTNGLGSNATGQGNVAAGVKRKAEDQLRRPQKPESEASAKPSAGKPVNASITSKSRPVAASSSAKSTHGNTATAAQKPPQISSKPPPKGSYADLMMKAKELQTKAPAQVGMFKHQPVAKEKLSKAERKRRALEAQIKEKESRLSKKPGTVSGRATGTKSGDGKLARKREHEELTYKGTARPSQTPTQLEYRGTAGLPSRRSSQEPKAQSRASKHARMNEYLATDEEDEGDDYDEYYSASSDMEAGYDDVEEEEAAALAAAKKEDEEELRAELAAKQEKLERRKKLAALAAKSRS
ncbi:hypothetical protein KXX57_001444 [Aspergillus fumigatus]|nr:hypothetical protein KXX57_001444 [Aspergillus fumigatus]KAH2654267.1 hypothetical protein KXV32_003043 [Aspergillus fumigatus]KAH2909443.1 hypothetical protein KXW25_004103 [Aspergillus fumigatus]KAH3195340.1 hypothetical protein KXW62_004161 [Aspergillus fumigatus]